VICKEGIPSNPNAQQTSKLARRVAKDLRDAGWKLKRLLSDNGNVEALHKTILDECWRPSFARYLHPRLSSLRRDLDEYLTFYNFDRVHHGRLTEGQIPADIVYGARKTETT